MGISLKKEMKEKEAQEALLFSLIALLVFVVLAVSSVASFALYNKFTVGGIFILVLQLAIGYYILIGPAKLSTKFKGLTALLRFVLIRLVPPLLGYDVSLVNTDMMVFLYFFVAYFIGALLAVEAFKEVYDG